MLRGKFGLISLFVGLLGGMGSASAAPCPTASLSAYQALGAAGCSIGSLTFADFMVDPFPGRTATQIAPGSVFLTPLADGFSLSSNGALFAGTNVLLGLRFLFDVSAPALTGGTVALGGQRSVSGDAAITALLSAGAAGDVIAIAIEGFAETPASFASSARSRYDAFFELGIDGGTFGSASLGPLLATVTFAAAPIPEPSVAALSLLGLVTVLVRSRRRRARG